LKRAHPDLFVSISVTTRTPRPGEQSGVDYAFVSRERFEEMATRGELLEWAWVFNEGYGSPSGPIDRARAEGRDAILEIDVQGARQVRERVPDAVLVLLKPPSAEELERRLRSRGTETEKRIAERLATAQRELAQAPRFDRVVVNDDVTRATEEVEGILFGSSPHVTGDPSIRPEGPES
jgi:guanylate kinase